MERDAQLLEETPDDTLIQDPHEMEATLDESISVTDYDPSSAPIPSNSSLPDDFPAEELSDPIAIEN